MTKKPEKLFFFLFFSFTSGFVYYGVVLMTTQLMQQTPENGTSCDSGIAYLPWQICSTVDYFLTLPLHWKVI